MPISEAELQTLVQNRDVQGLVNALELESYSADIRRSLIQLGSEALDILVPYLEHEDSQFRRVLARILGEIGDKRAVDPLIQHLRNDEEWRVRGDAAYALARIGGDKAIEALIKATDELVRNSITKTDELIPVDRSSHIEALGISQDKQALPCLQNALINDSAWGIRSGSLKALALIGGEEALAIIRRYVINEDNRLSEAAIRALGIMGDNRAAQHIKDQIDEDVYRAYHPRHIKRKPDPERGLAPDAIRRGAVEGLQMALEDERFRSRKAAIEELVAFADIASESIFAAIQDEHEQVSAAAVEALASIGNDKAIALLRGVLEDPIISHTAVSTLYKIGKPALETLIFALQSANPWVRNAAAEALGLLGDEIAIPALQTLLNDSHPQVRRSASIALTKLGLIQEDAPVILVDMPVLAYRVRNAWNEVLGSDSASFILYESGLVIYPSADSPSAYRSSQLSEAEKSDFLSLIPFETLQPQAFYRLTHATDQPVTSIFIRHNDAMNVIMIDGAFEREDTSQMPAFITQLYTWMKTFEHRQAVNWFPEKIEVLLWGFGHALKEGIPWPENWPNLVHETTVHRGRLGHEGVYSIYLDYQHFQELDEIVKSGEPIRLNKRKWSIKYRYPLPQETYLTPALKR